MLSSSNSPSKKNQGGACTFAFDINTWTVFKEELNVPLSLACALLGAARRDVPHPSRITCAHFLFAQGWKTTEHIKEGATRIYNNF